MTTTNIVVCENGVHKVVGTADISHPIYTNFADKEVENLVQNAVIKDFSILLGLPYGGEVKSETFKINVVSHDDSYFNRRVATLSLQGFLQAMRESASGTLYTSGDELYFSPSESSVLYKAHRILLGDDDVLFMADVYKIMQEKI